MNDKEREDLIRACVADLFDKNTAEGLRTLISLFYGAHVDAGEIVAEAQRRVGQAKERAK